MTGSNGVRVLTCDEVREMAGSFVLGALAAAEDASVRAHLETCADAHAEIAELGGVLPALAESVPAVEPPAGLKGRIMAAAAADLETRSGTNPAVAPTAGETWAPDAAMAAEDNAALEIAAVASVAGAPEPFAFPDAGEIAAIETGTVAPATPEPIPFPVGTERTARRRTPISSWVLRIAAVVAIVGLAGWNFLLRNQLDAAQSYEQSVAAVIEAAGQPGALTAILTPDAGTGTGVAAISSAGQVTLAMQDLAATSGATVYTTWAIGPDNVPVALGDFTVGGSGTASFTAAGPPGAPGVVIALTLEPGPGATAPTGPVVSKGPAT